MKYRWGFAGLLAGLVMLVTAWPFYSGVIQRVQTVSASDTIVIDPGHGGIDGGAVSAGGVCEKDINLNIAKEVKRLAEADGWKVVMTREEDKGLYTDVKNDGTQQAEVEGRRSIRSLKTEDLKNRKKLIERVEPVLAISIHLNSFKEDRSVHGAQTFYPKGAEDPAVTEQSKDLAEKIQESLIAGLADGTKRTALGKRDIMLFKNPKAPVAVVECGFLSNSREAELLQDEEYQKKLAHCIYEGIMEHSGREGKKPMQVVDTRNS